ncbi:glycosyltransferase [Suicoccus acidiformans]|nr:glycosyltransferase [Suicoccus acidiformans]
MNILMISTVNFGVNGISKVILQYQKYIDSEKYKYDFIFPNSISSELKESLFEKSSVYHVPNRIRNPLKYYKEIHKIMKDKHYDAVHVHGNSTTMALELLAAKKAGIEKLISHGHNSFTKYPIIHKVFKPMFDSLYTTGLTCSNKAGESLYGLDYIVIENGIDIKAYRYDENIRKEYRENIGYSRNHLVIGNIGRLSEQKNHEFLIDLMPSLLDYNDDFRLMIVGDGHLKNKLESKVRELELQKHVIFLGERKDISNLLSAIDVMVMPSLYEGLPITLIEGQASGLSCIASTNITREANVSGEVLYCNLNNPNEFIEAINYSLKNNSQKDRVIMNEMLMDSNYSIINSINKLQDIYQQ